MAQLILQRGDKNGGNTNSPGMRSGHFGAKGDLARRKLLPSLYQLEKAGQIHEQTRIIGVGRAEWDKAAYTKVVREALETFMKEKIDEALWDRLSNRLDFATGR